MRTLKNPTVKVAKSGCWDAVYPAPSQGGYCRIHRGGKSFLLHRHVYEKAVGPIPPGMLLDHLCRNPACCNPNHLEPVTHAENIRRGSGTKLTEADKAAIRRDLEIPRRVTAAKYGISLGYVTRIRKGLVPRLGA